MTTKTMGDYYCPVCGILGQLKLRSRNGHSWFYIDHYKGTKGLKTRLPLRRGSKYAYSCYIGKIAVTIGYEFLIPESSLWAIGRTLTYVI